jgi:hypothetical protein
MKKTAQMRRSGQRGVTLMEVLIAVSIVMILTVAIAYSIGLGIDAMDRTEGYLASKRRVINTQRMIERQLAGLMPAEADCVLENPEVPERIGFFQGEPTEMRFVSTYSLAGGSRGYPNILEFKVIPDQDAFRGAGVRLIVNERLYTGPLGAGQLCYGLQLDPAFGLAVPIFVPIQPRPDSFVLADKLEACVFRYLQPGDPVNPPQWLDRWVRPGLPTAVMINMLPRQGAYTSIKPMPLIFPLRVNADARERYAD